MSGLLAAGAFAAIVLAAGPSPAQHELSGRGRRGEWRIVWSLADAETGRSDFRRLVGEGVDFPFRSRRAGDRLVFFDADGRVEQAIALGPGEEGLASGDASAYVLWTVDPTASALRSFRFFRRGAAAPDWEVTARGDPILFAADGSLFVVAERAQGVDRFQRAAPSAGGSVQVVGAGGEVRGELPIYPLYSRFTGDGRRIAMLHDGELLVVGRNGRLEWDRAVPLDEMSPREGLSQLEAGGGVIVVAGTGAAGDVGSSPFGLHVVRRGSVLAYADDGKLLWRHDQPADEELWFQVAAAIAPDGSVVATCHSSRRDVVVRLHEGRTGEVLWTRSASRGAGFRSLSVTPDGGMTVLVHGASTSEVTAWDREGLVVWEGYLPVQGKVAKIGSHDLLAFDQWIVELVADRTE
jgi:outer membrane protein assembly factor BamB